MFFNKCGSANGDEAKFCNTCGEDIARLGETFALQDSNSSDGKKKPKNKRKLVRPSSLIALIVSLCFIGLIIGCVGNTDKGIEVSVECHNELFPAIQKYAAQEGERGDVEWKLTNPNSSQRTVTVMSQIQNWTDPVSKTLNLKPNESITFRQVSFGEKLLDNQNTTPASLRLLVKKGEKVIFDETRQVEIRGVEDMPWSTGNNKYNLAFLLASWVTPRDPAVEGVISKAKERMGGNAFTGYQKNNPQLVRDQMEAIFNEFRKLGVSYVSSTIDFGKTKESQRIRLPRTSIRDKQANCVDISVLLASCYENIGLEPIIFLVPGHAFLGVVITPGENKVHFIDATNIGRSTLISIFDLETTFDAATKKGTALYLEHKKTGDIKVVNIKKCREMGVRPLF
ncbi:MAG TPA: hypothetical protein PKH15_11010 [Bacteroidales bacterium]|nr:hypothetical protein [Bacteroidales bacterium]